MNTLNVLSKNIALTLLKTSIRAALAFGLAGMTALTQPLPARAAAPSVPLVLAPAFAPLALETCFATPDDGTTVFSSTNASAVQAAVDIASAGDIVKVAGTCAGVQVTAGTTQTVVITHALTLAGGFTVTNWNASDPVAHVTVLDAQGNGRVLLASAPVTVSNLTVQNGFGTGLSTGAGARFGSIATLNGVTFFNNTNAFGGGGAAFAVTATLTNTTFISNTSLSDQGGGALFSGAATLSATTFISNSATFQGGGALFVGPATLLHSDFLSNSTLNNGGAASFASVVSMTGGVFRGNRATLYGGAVYFNGAAALTDTTFISNQASQTGGGAWFNTDTVLLRTQFISNSASLEAGGAFFINSSGGNVMLVDSAFISNTSSELGGGAYFFSSGAQVAGGVFQGNRTGIAGGGAAFAGNATVTGTLFLSNTAAGIGGGASFGMNASVSQATFAGNSVLGDPWNSNGGGAWLEGGATVTDSVFINNTANANGGGAFFNGAAGVSGSQFVSNTAVNGIGAFFNGDARVSDSQFTRNAGTNFNGFATTAGGAMFNSAAVLTRTDFLSNVVQGAGGAHFRGPATLTGGVFEGNRALIFNAGGAVFSSGTQAIISGTRFINNVSGDVNGSGGVLVNSGAVMTNAAFIGNAAVNAVGTSRGIGSGGGGKFIGPVSLVNTDFIANQIVSGTGGGASFINSTFTLSNTRFIGNVATRDGGGLALLSSSGASRIVNSVLARNASTAGRGDAVWVNDASGNLLEIVHTTISSPTLAAGAAVAVLTGSVSLTNTLLSNHAVAISQSAGAVSSDGNLFFGNTLDTQGAVVTGSNSVVGNPFFVNAAADNYRISPASFAANRGLNLGIATDFDGNPRPFGPQVDIGAFEVQAANQPPVANAGAPFTTTVNATLALDGSASSDPEGLPLVFGWTQLSGTPVTLDNSAAMSPIFTAPALTGTLVFQLVVTDSAGLASAPAWVTVTIANNTLPPSSVGFTHTIGSGLQPTTFFTATVAGGTEPFTYEWAFSDGVTSMGSEPFKVRQLAPGVYTVTLTVSNTAGAASATQQVNVPWRMTLAIIVKDSTLPMLQQSR